MQDTIAPDERTRLAYTTSRRDVCSLVPMSATRILDLGCSNGSLGAALKSARPDRTVWGIEVSSELAAEAKENIDRVVCLDLDQPIDWSICGGQKFDCIIAADVLEHLKNPENILSALDGLLSAHGVLVVSLPNIRHHSAAISIFLQGKFPRRERGIFDRTHLRWFTRSDAFSLLAEAGFVVDKEYSNLRVGDRGGGLINKIASRLLDPIAGFPPVRELMTYQFVFRARRARDGELS